MSGWLRRLGAPFRAALRPAGAAPPAQERGAFAPTRLLWSRGLALLCDHNGGTAFIREQRGGGPALRFDAEAYDHVRDGELVWVRATALPQFLHEALPRIRARFALVTGDEDWSIPLDFDGAAELCEHRNLVCWFAQNCDGRDRSGKILPLPIGMDFHTISNAPRWGHAQASPAQQEAELEALRAAMPANGARVPRVHADFHFNRHGRPLLGETRAAVEAVLRPNPLVEFQRRKLSRTRLWRNKTRYAFTVSPHGNGLDCHRTWESLALGNIVIVRHSPLDPLYEGLPVVIVDRWEDITAQNLALWHAQLREGFSTPEFADRLTNRYWIERMRSLLHERMSRSEHQH
ncbi:MAG TPA: hypothetical protein VHX52_11300 [Steroidobacteraceae bacterium]|jgi:hypothetical protein|nr:hypothetical protein [Steroidobacteraceae bacterium]